MKLTSIIFALSLLICSHQKMYAQNSQLSDKEIDTVNTVQKDWKSLNPGDISGLSDKTVEFKVTDNFLNSPGIMRRDPSDIIFFEGNYYVWYTKVLDGQTGYPGGWKGLVWYATSPDGRIWTEKDLAIDKGDVNAWDGAGTYTPNIIKYGSKFYLAYTAMPAPFIKKFSQASIGIAVANSPDGPWEKLENNPVITPGAPLDSPDGFLADDAVFMLRDNKIWLYYKGYPKVENEGRAVRAGRNTFLIAATADKPEGPYTKVPKIMHRGHEVMVWKEENGIGSMGLAAGPKCFYWSKDGLNFKAVHKLNPVKAAGIYRPDLTDANHKGERPSWGIAMGENQGLCRFEIHWPE